jgi:hypothetical protein
MGHLGVRVDEYLAREAAAQDLARPFPLDDRQESAVSDAWACGLQERAADAGLAAPVPFRDGAGRSADRELACHRPGAVLAAKPLARL